VSNHDSQGWSIRRRGTASPGQSGRIFTVRYCINGIEGERSTETNEREAALERGAQIYAEEVIKAAREAPRRRFRGDVKRLDFVDVLALWLAALENTHAKATVKIWLMYARTHWIPFFQELCNLTEGNYREYVRARLGKVQRATVKKECTALRSLIEFAVEEGALEKFEIPKMPKKSAGVVHPTRRRVAAVPLTEEQVEAFLAALPEWSSGKGGNLFPIRARFVLAYETSLRPSTLDRLRAPTHYQRGEPILRLSNDTDKAKWGRDTPLTPRAREALDSVLDRRGPGYEGPIFGAHEFREWVDAAARAALPPELAGRFCAAHLRSARITHLLEMGASLPGVQHWAGHKLVSTTSKYVRPSFRAATEVLDVVARHGKPARSAPSLDPPPVAAASLPTNVIPIRRKAANHG